MTKPILIIDPGHGGKDPGGGSNSSFVEKDMVLDISLYQYERFKQLGVPITLTRDKDIYLSSTERTNIVKSSGAKYCISNHINAAGNTSARGAETIHSIHSDGKLAHALLNAIVAEGMPKRRVFTRQLDNGADYYFMHRMTGNVSTTIIEYGFATNAEDSKLLQTNWRVYAEAVVRSFCVFIGNKYVAPSKPSKTPKGVSEWAEDGYKFVVDNDLSDGKRPKDTITREEMWTMLDRYHKLNNS